MKYFLLAFLLSFTVFASPPHSLKRLIVKVNQGKNLPNSRLIRSSKKLFNNIFVVYSQNISKLEKYLKQNNDIVYIEKDYLGTKNKLAKKSFDFNIDFSKDLGSPFNDPHVSRQWTLNDSEVNGISVKRTFFNRRSNPQEEIIVAVVDTGVDYNHPDLPMWTNEDEIPNNGIDDDNNGYIDDIYGINTLVRDSNGNATMNVMDAHSHGTHVSGSIGAIQNNGIGIAGIASKVKIMAIRTVPNRSDETDVDVIEAFIYAAKNGAKIINCSFGKSHNEGGMAVSEAIEFIGKEYGVLVVAAAGNSSRNIDQYLSYPASFENSNLLVVASTSKYGSMSYFSNYGLKNVDVATPGSGIYSTTPRGNYSNMSGTSMASPNTAGVAAEVLANYPNLTPEELKDIIINSVTKVPSFSMRILSGGRIDLEKALKLALEK